VIECKWIIVFVYFGDDFCMAFIIGLYNKYDGWDREHSVYKFEING